MKTVAASASARASAPTSTTISASASASASESASAFTRGAVLLLALLHPLPTLASATTPAQASEFAWRASLTVPAGANAAQVRLPADAMLQFKSASRSDLRVFNGNGEAVPTTLVAPPASTAAADRTGSFTALALLAAGAEPPAGNGLKLQMKLGGEAGAVWVQVDGGEAGKGTTDAGRSRLPAVLLDTRKATQTVVALDLDAVLPANTLVPIALAHSADLHNWTPVAVKGPLFWFDGAGAPRNTTLALEQPLKLENQYLRLSWGASTQVQISSAVGLTAPRQLPAVPLRAPLTAAKVQDGRNWTWQLAFATPMSGLYLQTARANTVLAVRLLGRNDAAEPWRLLGQGVVYRGGPDQPTNGSFPLHNATPRWLRVEASHGMTLADAELTAQAEFQPVQLVFLASGPPPFELAVGRAQTASAIVDASLLRAVVPGPLEAVPTATIGNIRVQDITPWSERLLALLPGGIAQRSMVLWLVLAAAVLLLCGVAFTLLRQMAPKAEGLQPSAGNSPN